MKVLHLMVSGEIGGIEVMMKNYANCSKHENIFLFLWRGGEIANEMKRDGKDIRVWDIKRDGMLRTLKKITRMCQEERVDALVAHHSAPFLKIVIMWIRLRLPEVATVAYKHDAEEWNLPADGSLKEKTAVLIKRMIHRQGFSWAHGVIAISEYVKRNLVNHLHIPEDKISVIYNGVPVSEFQSKERNPSDTVKLIYVGRLIPGKGVQNIISAVGEISKSYRVSLDIVGDGTYREALEKQVARLELHETVCFRGAVRNVSEYLAQSDLFIHMPEWEEGFGITVVEAMAAGCLCICAAKGGIPEIIRNGIDGFLVSSSSIEELVQILQKQIPEYLTGKCQHIREYAISRAEEFSVQVYAENFERYVEMMCKKSKT